MISPSPSPSVALAVAAAPAEDEPNQNLFLWTEEMQQAAWTTNSVTVTADTDLNPPGTETTADRLAFVSGSISQLSSLPATTGATVSTLLSPTAAWLRYSVSGTFDGVVYVASVYLCDPSDLGLGINLRIFRSGGFIAAGLVDAIGDEPTLVAWGWKLETPNLTDYVKREGT